MSSLQADATLQPVAVSTPRPVMLPLTPAARFLNSLIHFVLSERDAQRQQIEAEWRKPLAERAADGFAIPDLRFLRLTDEGHIEFACAHNRSRFREGDILLLNRGGPFSRDGVLVNLEVDDGDRLEVSLADVPGFEADMLRRQPDGCVLDQGFLDLSGSVIDALQEAGATRTGVDRILPLLMGDGRPRTDLARYEAGLDIAQSLHLNDDQQEGFAQAYATDLAWLVQGPPGTGKTRVLAHLAAQLARDGERVFVTAFTHRAINNALNAVAKVSPEIELAKIGQERRGDDLIGVPNYTEFYGCPMAESEEGYVIGATPFSTRTRRLQDVTFDTVIFDEASQITLPLAVMGMLPSRRYLFFGDHRQLAPVLTGRRPSAMVSAAGASGESVFEVLAGHGFDTLLTETYRLNDVLTDWPSRSFYQGALKPASQKIAEQRVTYVSRPTRFGALLDPALPKVFLDLEHFRATSRQRQEAQVVADLVVTLTGCGIAPADIGVVTPYRAQGREIRERLRGLLQRDQARQVVVDTVERMQGQERLVVIVSLTTSNTAFARQVAEFYFQPQRLNVAVTRPSHKLILVGSRHVLDTLVNEPEQQAAVELMRELIDGCAYFTLADADGAGGSPYGDADGEAVT